MIHGPSVDLENIRDPLRSIVLDSKGKLSTSLNSEFFVFNSLHSPSRPWTQVSGTRRGGSQGGRTSTVSGFTLKEGGEGMSEVGRRGPPYSVNLPPH